MKAFNPPVRIVTLPEPSCHFGCVYVEIATLVEY
jgi:hypothetical protein